MIPAGRQCPGGRPRYAGLGALTAGIRELDPGYFAFVMATGIISAAVSGEGLPWLSGVLLGIAVVAYPVLVVCYAWRFVSYRREFLADATEPRTAFAYFTFVAGTNVLGARLGADGHLGATAGLLIAAALAWVLLSYLMPVWLVTHHGTRSALAGVNGTWFLWTVGTESIAISAAALGGTAGLVPVAVACWGAGVLLYVLISALVLAALLQFPVEEAGLTPAYWVFMGATAISVRAGALLLELPATTLLTAVRPVVAGLSVVLWAFGTWLVPLLAGLGLWRHRLHHAPFRYHPAVWSMVFPLGMYSVAGRALGTVLRVPWLVSMSAIVTWIAFAVWVLVSAGMLGSFLGLPRGGAGRSVPGQ